MVINVSSFIDSNYSVLNKSESVDSSTSKVFLLTDFHGNPLHAQVNSLFINTFAREGDIVLIEGHPSMQPLDPSTLKMSARLETKAQILGDLLPINRST